MPRLINYKSIQIQKVANGFIVTPVKTNYNEAMSNEEDTFVFNDIIKMFDWINEHFNNN